MANWTPLHARLHITLRQRQLLPQQARLLVAVSGGQDSLCLAKLLLDLRSKWGWDLAIAHCDHGWALDAGMAAHVATIAQQWQIPFYLQNTTNLKETEAEARKWRYTALNDLAQVQDFPYLVVGHTQSDRAETILYNLIRGAGSDGLQALTWVRSLSPSVTLVRPLLNVTRQETLSFCQQFQLPIWEDPFNDQLQFARNRLRKAIIPELITHFNPNVEKNLAQTAEILQAEVTYLEAIATETLNTVLSDDGKGLNRKVLGTVPLAIQRRVIRQFLQHLLNKAVNFEQIEAVTALMNAPNRSQSPSLSGSVSLCVKGDWIRLVNS